MLRSRSDSFNQFLKIYLSHFLQIYRAQGICNVNLRILDLLDEANIIHKHKKTILLLSKDDQNKIEVSLQQKNLIDFFDKKQRKIQLKELLNWLKVQSVFSPFITLPVDLNDPKNTTPTESLNKAFAELLNPTNYVKASGEIEDLCQGVGFNADEIYNPDPPADPRFNFWKINEVTWTDENGIANGTHLYATQGASPNANNIANFFYEILTNDLNLQYIVLLGQVGTDFHDYISAGKRTFSLEKPKCVISVKSDGCTAHANEANSYQKYELRVRIDFPDGKTPIHSWITALHIPVEDGFAPRLSDNMHRSFYGLLLKALQEDRGVLIHCKAGLGRTGYVVAVILALMGMLDDILEQCLKANNLLANKREKEKNLLPITYTTEIHKLIMSYVIPEFLRRLRNKRHFILQNEQLYYFLIDYVRYKQLNPKFTFEKPFNRRASFEEYEEQSEQPDSDDENDNNSIRESETGDDRTNRNIPPENHTHKRRKSGANTEIASTSPKIRNTANHPAQLPRRNKQDQKIVGNNDNFRAFYFKSVASFNNNKELSREIKLPASSSSSSSNSITESSNITPASSSEDLSNYNASSSSSSTTSSSSTEDLPRYPHSLRFSTSFRGKPGKSILGRVQPSPASSTDENLQSSSEDLQELLKSTSSTESSCTEEMLSSSSENLIGSLKSFNVSHRGRGKGTPPFFGPVKSKATTKHNAQEGPTTTTTTTTTTTLSNPNSSSSKLS